MVECAVIKMTDTLKWAGTVPIHASEQRSWFVGCDQLSSVKKLFSSQCTDSIILMISFSLGSFQYDIIFVEVVPI